MQRMRTPSQYRSGGLPEMRREAETAYRSFASHRGFDYWGLRTYQHSAVDTLGARGNCASSLSAGAGADKRTNVI